jgi:hypothetical protein
MAGAAQLCSGVGTRPMWRSGKPCFLSFGTAPNTGTPVYASMLRVRILLCRLPATRFKTTPPTFTSGSNAVIPPTTAAMVRVVLVASMHRITGRPSSLASSAVLVSPLVSMQS